MDFDDTYPPKYTRRKIYIVISDGYPLTHGSADMTCAGLILE